jgi:hypothetical protein
MRKILSIGLAAALVLTVAGTTLAAKGGHGGAGANAASCTVSPSPAAVGQAYVVSVIGLPTGATINLWVTDPSGTVVGSPVGRTPDGTFNLTKSSNAAGLWTYAFSGPTGNHMTWYATCSVTAF